MGKDLLPLHQRITVAQKQQFINFIRSGHGLISASQLSDISPKNPEELRDLLNDPDISVIIQGSIHNDIVTRGKNIAWQVLIDLMENPKTPANTRFSAARWTLEASGEGIGQTREKKSSDSKDLHEMTEEELQRFIRNARQVIEQTAIDVTPSREDDTPAKPSDFFS